MRERALALDDDPVGPLGRVADHLLGGTRDEIRDHRIDGDALARDRDPGLTGGDERGALPSALQRAHELEGDRHLPHCGVGAHRKHHARCRSPLTMAADREIRRRFAELADPTAAPLRGVAQGRVRQHALVQPIPDLEAPAQRVCEQRPV